MTESLDYSSPPAAFDQVVEAMGLAFDPGERDKLGRYLQLLYETNKQMNLTAIRDPETAWMRHITDSLSLVPVLASVDSSRIIDVGSGGGLPGIPLSIVTPDSRFVLLEATGKKAAFLQRVVDELSLENVRVVPDRAETAASHGSAHRAAFDVVVARAVGPLPVLVELTVPLATVGGYVVAIKGERASQEIQDAAEAMSILRCEVVDMIETQTGTIVIIRKNKATPRSYPRRPGEPKRKPLGVEDIEDARGQA
ncbi:MAG: 16S rRNA (guanine(527)-N(7))-methyltransferase RsmG [Phycisphaerales bacterium]|nr:16S rRNA (guanine(527)-N(7))-methyltransferase RsmG [Phycisphaerales bacterium]